MIILDLRGKRFGRLVVINRQGSVSGKSLWLCLCDCGKSTLVRANSLGRHTNSCGCLFKELRATSLPGYKHGKYNTKEYHAWEGMKRRCLYPSHANYENYGGRGIAVCRKWLDSFVEFLNDVGYAPSNAHSIDRINNDGDYEPGNVRWATKSEQSANQRKRRKK